MPLPGWREELPKRVLGMQIIVAALVMGCLFFSFIVTFFFPSALLNDGSKLVTGIAVAFACLALIVRIVVPTIMVSLGRRRIFGEFREKPAGQELESRADSFDKLENDAAFSLLGLLQGKLIVSAALIEGPTFFLLIAYMLEHSPIALAAAIVMMVILALHLPTLGRAANWVEGQLQLLRDEF